MILSIITPTTNAGKRNSLALCKELLTDASACLGSAIQAPQVSCSGFETCSQSPSIVSKGKNGGVECTGSRSCAEATLISTGKNVYCQGYESCFSAGSIDAKIVQCSGAKSCSNVDLITTQTLMYCGGFKACEKSTIITEKVCNCDGLNSCVGAKITSQDEILCQGTKSCLAAKINTPSVTQCSGDKACKKAKIKAKTVKLYGSSAGEEAQISAEEVEAFGYNTLSYGEIDSVNRTSLKVKVSREAAGTDSTVICREGCTCSVECVDGCEALEVVQMQGSTTEISVSEPKATSTGLGKTTTTVECDTTSSHSNTTDGCPTMKVSSSDCEDREIETYLGHKRAIIAQRLSALNMDDNDDDDKRLIMEREQNNGAGMEEIEPEIEECHTALTCRNAYITDNNAECYGFEACSGASIVQISNTEGQIRGYAEGAIEHGSIDSKGEAQCYGKDSCIHTARFDAKTAICAGYESCMEVQNIMDVQSLECLATRSCSGNHIFANGNVKCNANRACVDSIITAGKSIQCEGHYGCAGSDIAAAAIKCTSQGACHQAIIRSSKSIYVDGDKAASKAEIYGIPGTATLSVRVYGYGGLTGGIIDSNGTQTLKIKMEGDLAGKEGLIICRPGSTCKLDCLSSACKDLDYYCSANAAACTVTPRECMQPRGPIKANEIWCPTIITETIEDSDKFWQYIEQKQIERLKEESYSKIMEKFEFGIDREEEELNLMDEDIVSDIEISGMQEMNNGWNAGISFFTWNMGLLLGVIIFIITMIICYLAYNHFKLKREELLYYQHLK